MNVLDRQAENLILTQLLIGWIRRHETSQIVEGAIYVLLPAFQITDGEIQISQESGRGDI